MTSSRKRPHGTTTPTTKKICQRKTWPEYIRLHEEVLYYYFATEATAKQFIDGIAVNPNKKVTNLSYPEPRPRYLVMLTKTECDKIFGKGSFAFFETSIEQSYHAFSGTFPVDLASQDSELIQQIFLLINHHNTRLCDNMLFGYYASDFLSCVEKLSPEFCTHLAFILEKSGLLYERQAAYPLNDADENPDPFLEFMQKLDTDTCNALATRTTDNQWSYLHVIGAQPTPLFTLFMGKLTPGYRLLGMTLKDKTGVTPIFMMLHHQSREALGPYIAELYHAGYKPETILAELMSPAYVQRFDDRILSANIMALLDDLTDDAFHGLVENTTVHNTHCGTDVHAFTFLGALLALDNTVGETIYRRIPLDKLRQWATRALPARCSFATGMEEIIVALRKDGKVPSETLFKLFFALGVEARHALALKKTRHGDALLIEMIKDAPDLNTLFLEALTDDEFNQLMLSTYQGETVYEYLVTTAPPGTMNNALRFRLTPGTIARLAFATIFGSVSQDLPVTIDPAQLHMTNQHAPLKLLGTALQHPGTIRQLAKSHTQLVSIDIFDGGNSSARWPALTSHLLKQVPEIRRLQSYRDLTSCINPFKASYDNPQALANLEDAGWQFLRIQGRTLLFQNTRDDILAVKICKTGKDHIELMKEQQATKILRRCKKQHAPALQSELPTPLACLEITDLFAYLANKVPAAERAALHAMVGERPYAFPAYLYRTDTKSNGYFTYLHDASLTDAAFAKANQAAVHDLFTLLQHGMAFPQLADIFHNTEHQEEREDRGRYMVLVDILRPNFGRTGSGRITGWQQAVQFPNLRASGIADLGDCVSLNDFIGYSELALQFFSEALIAYKKEYAGNYLLANLMAEYQYVLFLIAGRRGVALMEQARDASSASLHQIWKTLATQVFQNVVQAAAILTRQSERKITTLLSAIVDVDRLAAQMHYWMTQDYVADVRKSRIPPDIYDRQTKVNIQFKQFRKGTYDPTLGCAINGKDPDLGPVNGQEPIKEANKLFYWMVNYVVYSYLELTTTLKELSEITAEKSFYQSEERRRNAFFHLPEKNYHALQTTLCQERLKQHDVPDHLRAALRDEAQQHQRTHAAITLQQFWRNKKAMQTGEISALPRLRSEAKLKYS